MFSPLLPPNKWVFFVVLVSGFCLLHLPSSSGTYVSKCTNRDNSSSFYSSFFEVLFSGQMVACLEQVCHTLTCFVYTISPSSGTSVAKCTNLDKSTSLYSSSFLLKLRSKVRIPKHFSLFSVTDAGPKRLGWYSRWKTSPANTPTRGTYNR